jgi:putative transposase
MIVEEVEAAVAAGSRRAAACEEVGLDPRTVERWRASGVADDGRTGPRQAPRNKLTPAERARIIAVATSAEGRDLSPKQLVPRLADQGTYVGSESTVYRVLRAEKLMAHRGRAAAPTPRPRCAVPGVELGHQCAGINRQGRSG